MDRIVFPLVASHKSTSQDKGCRHSFLKCPWERLVFLKGRTNGSCLFSINPIRFSGTHLTTESSSHKYKGNILVKRGSGFAWIGSNFFWFSPHPPIADSIELLEGKVALITGAAGGLGESIAKLFAEYGAKIIIADIKDELGQAVCEAIGSSNSIYVHCDVSNEEDVKNVVDVAISTYGKLDIMFNNAAIVDPLKPNILENEKIYFEQVLNVNVTGVFLGMKHAARVMVPRRTGCIVSTSSVASQLSGMSSHAYSASKHAIVGLTRNLAVELGQYGIRVNSLSPHGMFTPMISGNYYINMREDFEKLINSTANLKGGTLTTDVVANAALFLVSDDAKYISGHNLLVDGGFTIVSPINMFTPSENH